MSAGINLGAEYLGQDRTRFVVWAPFRERVDVHIFEPQERMLSLDKDERGYFGAVPGGIAAGSLYLYRLDGQSEYADPASRFQPQGVHGPS